MPDQSNSFCPTTQDELAKWLANNASQTRQPLFPSGGGTALGHLAAKNSNAIEVRLEQLNRVIDYPARDMTITVEAGIRMAELSRILAAENQRLPVDVPQAEQATLGGVVATNWSGSRRFGCGTMRDYVIGISAIDSSGRDFKAGGRVVKNVAGYDICKLLVGSRGTLAIITQITLKLRPIPTTSAFLCLAFSSLSQVDAVLARLLSSATRPVAIDVLNPAATKSIAAPNSLPANQFLLCLGFEGTERETNWQIETALAECRSLEPSAERTLAGTAADSFWKFLTDFSMSGSRPSFKANLLPSRTMEFLQLATNSGVAVQAHAGNGIVIGCLAANIHSLAQAEALLKPLRDFAHSSGGSFSFLSAPQDWDFAKPTWNDLGAAANWMKKLKAQLDPQNLLRPEFVSG